MRSIRLTIVHLATGVAALLLVSSACGGGGGKKSSGGEVGAAGNAGQFHSQIYAENSTGTPRTGGTLTMLGVGDVDNSFDPNYAYYTVDYLAMRMYERNLYVAPALHGHTFNVVPDLATDFPQVSNNGLVYTVTLRKGALWNSTPPRQVTAADVVRGVKRSCNPTAPYAGQADFSDILAGYLSYCTAFSNVSTTSPKAQADFINSHNIAGVTVDPTDSSGLTVDFKLTKPASYFTGILSLGPFNPAPMEYLNYLPTSSTLGNRSLSDGPYEVKSYNPGKSILFVRNPVWNPHTDPVRKAYVNEIEVSETGNQQQITQEILTNTPQADMMWDTGAAPSAVPGLIASKNPGFSLLSEAANNPWIVFNTISKNNAGALGNVQVRQALSYAISRTQLQQNEGGLAAAPPQTHIIPAGTLGATPDFDLYPFNPTKAKQMLAAAGYPNGLRLKMLYRPASITSTKDFQTIQANLGAIGVKLIPVTATNADFYAKDLSPGTLAKSSGWDLVEAGWFPDWYPTGNKTMFLPVLDGRNLPPNSSNFGFFNDPKATALYDQALAATSLSKATSLWQQADREVMAQAPLYPITNPNNPELHNTRVHNCIYLPVLQNCDPTNIWLS